MHTRVTTSIHTPPQQVAGVLHRPNCTCGKRMLRVLSTPTSCGGVIIGCMDSGVASRSDAVSGEAMSGSASPVVAFLVLGTATMLIVHAARVHASGISSSVVADSNAPVDVTTACAAQTHRKRAWSRTHAHLESTTLQMHSTSSG
jgi:hypothetical protein